MALPKIFKVGRAFSWLEIFRKIFFSKDAGQNSASEYSIGFFPSWGRGTQKRAQSQKSGWNNASLPRATTEILSPEVRPRGGASEKGVLT